MEHVLDATNKSLGVIASEAASILRGKKNPAFQPNKISDDTVVITNASKVALSDKKLAETYAKYSGYPGGLRMIPRSRVIEKHGYGEVFKRAVYGMLPSNKLRSLIMKKLTVKG